MKILVIHGLTVESRLTNLQHATCFARHSYGASVKYVSCFGFVNKELLDDEFDLGIVTYEVLSQRNTPYWPALARRLAKILDTCRVRVLMPQDDYSSCALLDEFVCTSSANYVYTPITRDLEVLYPKSVKSGVKFLEALTGYWESRTSLPYAKFRLPFRQRSIDVGQRVRYLPPQFGSQASRKGYLAEKFGQESLAAGFNVDVSTRDEDVLIGDDWWRFLGNIRFTVGRLGGASVADPDGSLAMQVYRMRIRRPMISDAQITKKLKWKNARNGSFSAISPRLFEAAAMGVCQILEPAKYFEGFEPWIHYIPLASDLGNLTEVFATMRDVTNCEEIVMKAEEFLIGSQNFTYRAFVRSLLRETVGFEVNESSPIELRDIDDEILHRDEYTTDRRSRRHPFLKACPSATDKWIVAYSRGELMPESFFVPWISAQDALSQS